MSSNSVEITELFKEISDSFITINCCFYHLILYYSENISSIPNSKNVFVT